MKLKRLGLASMSIFGILFLAGCNPKTPELSFEETLRVFGEQKSPITEIMTFINDEEKQSKTTLDVSSKYETDESTNGKIALKTTIINDNKTEDSSAEISLLLDTDEDIDSEDGFSVKSAKIDIDTLIKDYNIYFRLIDLSVDANQKDYISMMMALIDQFKNKWYKIDNQELSEMLKASSNDTFKINDFLKKYENQEKIFKDEELTKYDGDPAWRVSFNTEEIRSLIKEAYDLEQKEASYSYETTGEIEEQKKAQEDFNELVDEINIENAVAYFVIRSKDKVEFIIENVDVEIGNLIINISEKINKNWFKRKGFTFTINVFQKESDETETDSERIKMIINLEPKILSCGVGASIESLVGEEVGSVLTIKGDLKLSKSENSITLKPTFKITAEGIVADIDAEFINEKVENYSFTAPEGAESIENVIGELLGGNYVEEGSEGINNEIENNIDEEDEEIEYEEKNVEEAEVLDNEEEN